MNLAPDQIKKSRARLIAEGYTEDRTAVRVHDELLRVLSEQAGDPDRHLDRSIGETTPNIPAHDDELLSDLAWQIEAGVESEENYHQIAARIAERFDIRRRP